MYSKIKIIIFGFLISALVSCATNKHVSATKDFNPQGKTIGIISLIDNSFVLNYGVLSFDHTMTKYRVQPHIDHEWHIAEELVTDLSDSITIGQSSLRDITNSNPYLTSGFYAEYGKVHSTYLEHIAKLPETQGFDLLMLISGRDYVLPGTQSAMVVPLGGTYISLGETPGQSSKGYGLVSGGKNSTYGFMSINIYIVDLHDKKTVLKAWAEKTIDIDIEREPDSGELKYLFGKIKYDFRTEESRNEVKKLLEKGIVTDIEKQKIIDIYKTYSNEEYGDENHMYIIKEKLYPKDIPPHKSKIILKRDAKIIDSAFQSIQKDVVKELSLSLNELVKNMK